MQAIADPKRLLIIDALRDGERSVGEIAEGLGLSQPNTSQHLAVLRERKVVTATRSGTTVFYSLNGLGHRRHRPLRSVHGQSIAAGVN